MNRRRPARIGRIGGLAALAAAAILAFTVPAIAQPEGVRIGYVDMQRLIDSAPQVAAARGRLTGEFASRDAELELQAQRLAAMQARIQREGDTLAAAELAQLREEAEALDRSIAHTRERLAAELSRRLDEELDRAWPLIEAAVAEYAREAGYDLILSSPVVYASGRVDVTDRVLDRMRRTAAESP
ncbi:MAG TPA: OmpH family outer membrane protein [Xanthomonadaceae bacterium]|nr:OmpH family outer membrane protein [Xanthomonadaceae bacterium]